MQWKSRGLSCIEDVILANHPEDDSINEFLNVKPYYFIQNLDDMAQFIMKGITDGRPFTIIGDYDADGVCSTYELYLLLKELGAADITIRLPRRFSEGYGLNESIIDEIEEGILLTVDNGIAACEAIEKAKKKGLLVGIIDHHLNRRKEDGTILNPPADIIVDPNADGLGGDFNGYCAAGLVYKLAQHMGIQSKSLEYILSYAAIATVADVMDLVKDNRKIVMEGLSILNDFRKCPMALSVLMREMYCKTLTAKDIGFMIGPVINASGRLLDDGARKVLEYFMSKEDFPSLVEKAKELKEINQERKELIQEETKRIQEYITDNCIFYERPMIIQMDDLHEGVLGIIAGRLAEEWKTPTFVLTKNETGEFKGSGRSYGSIDLKDLMDHCQESLLSYGGHKAAGGIKIADEACLNQFKEMSARYLEGKDLDEDEVYVYDLELTSEDDIDAVLEELKKFEPFGQGNPAVTFLMKDFTLTPVGGKFYEAFGDSNDPHLKCNGKNISMIGFRKFHQFQEAGCPRVLHAYGQLLPSENGGRFELEDFEAVHKKKERSSLSKALSRELMNF